MVYTFEAVGDTPVLQRKMESDYFACNLSHSQLLLRRKRSVDDWLLSFVILAAIHGRTTGRAPGAIKFETSQFIAEVLSTLFDIMFQKVWKAQFLRPTER